MESRSAREKVARTRWNNPDRQQIFRGSSRRQTAPTLFYRCHPTAILRLVGHRNRSMERGVPAGDLANSCSSWGLAFPVGPIADSHERRGFFAGWKAYRHASPTTLRCRIRHRSFEKMRFNAASRIASTGRSPFRAINRARRSTGADAQSQTRRVKREDQGNLPRVLTRKQPGPLAGMGRSE